MVRRLFMISVSTALMIGAAKAAQDAPVVINPLHASEGYMFDWIFFAIMIPIPAFLYLDMVRNRRS